MSVVVSDTSPIRALHYLDLLSVLGEIYNEVLVPPAVRNELEFPPPQFEAVNLFDCGFIQFRDPGDVAQVQLFRRSLDAGESEALALALEVNAAAVIIDEAAGRKRAKSYGIRTIGTMGILLQAKGDRPHR